MFEAPQADVMFARLTAEDLMAIVRQPRQRMLYGIDAAPDADEAAALAAEAVAWSCFKREGEGKRLIACFGIGALFARAHGVAWAVLASDIGVRTHLALTRFVRGEVERADFARLELIARANDLEPFIASMGPFDSGEIVALAEKVATPEIRWAKMIGFTPAHLLRRYGAAGESYMLCERFAGGIA